MSFLASSLSIPSNYNRSNSIALPILLASAGATVGLISYLTKKKNKKESIHHHGIHHNVQVTLPTWAIDELPLHLSKTYETDEEMMALAIHLSARNVEENTGGPFGCAIFERNIRDNTATLVSVGVNRVVALGNSTLHGETVAIQLAQAKLKSYTMQLVSEHEENDYSEHKKENDDTNHTSSSKTMRQFEMFTSCEPCCMCLGATLWSGVSRIVCGATKYDAEAIGFDEGPVFDESYEHLRKAGIKVKKSVLQPEAAKVLQQYAKQGLIYSR